MKKIPVALVLGLLLLTFSQCVEIIEFDTTREGGQLVVDGRIGPGEGPYELYLGQTASTERKTFPLEDADVVIFDDQGRSESYVDLGEGKYMLPGLDLQGEIGRTYHLRITLPDGRVYESKPETLPPNYGRLDSIYFEFTDRQELNAYGNITTFPVVNAKVDYSVEQPATFHSFFRFDVEEVYLLSPTDFPDPFGTVPPPCFVYDFSNEQPFLLSNVEGDQPGPYTNLNVATQILDWRFEERHYFTVYLRSISREAWTFWDQVDQTISSVGTIFDSPPAPIRGNIFNVNDPEEQVLGYFSAESTDTIRRFMTAGDTPRRPLLDCLYFPYKSTYPPRCLDCLSVPGSTYERPEYF